ncbi:hypothetical protein CP49_34750 [Bradyrhizobium valentinum]|uniref:Uncharacterized protein n=1 Tax=Bradyrhizobium valentinum TaxID=1518501 RepID=A0A0R3L338_9BRAD|nr:hypothetical protein CP49_34750 [Bradyrhizobium valentinum]
MSFISSVFWSSDSERRSRVETHTIPSLASYSFRMSSIVSASTVRASAGALRHHLALIPAPIFEIIRRDGIDHLSSSSSLGLKTFGQLDGDGDAHLQPAHLFPSQMQERHANQAHRTRKRPPALPQAAEV